MRHLTKVLSKLQESEAYCSFKISNTHHFLGFISNIEVKPNGSQVIKLTSKEEINGEPKETLICYPDEILEVFPIFDDIEIIL